LSSGGVTIYAIIETGGKQYKVTPGKNIKVEALDFEEGADVVFDRVLAIGDTGKLVLGNPVIAGAKVNATSNGNWLGTKVYGMKYKAKTRYNRRFGHRQVYTELTIKSISGLGVVDEALATDTPKTAEDKEVTKNGS